MPDDDVIVVNDNEKKKKEARTKFGRFLQKNKVNLLFILIALIFIGSVLFTYLRSKADVKQEGAETTEVVSISSIFSPRKVVYKQESLSLNAIRYPDVDSQEVQNFQDDTDYTFITWLTGEQLVGKRFDETDTFTFYLLTNSLNGGSSQERLSIAIYRTDTQDFEYSMGNLVYNIVTYASSNTMSVRNWYGITYADFFQSSIDRSGASYATSIATWNITNDGGLYDAGYQQGYVSGVNEVLADPSIVDLYTEAQVRVKEDVAFNEGKDYAFSQMNDFNLKTLVFTILEAPSKLLDMFNFEIFGINFKVIVTFLISIALVLFVIGLFKKG